MSLTDQRETLERRGFVLLSAVLIPADVQRLLTLIEQSQSLTGERRRADRTYAVRHLLWDIPLMGQRLRDCGLDRVASELLSAPAFPISATLFDKNPEANWAVPAHQDLMMPIEDATSDMTPAELSAADEGFEGWCDKAGVRYVEPPATVLSNLVALRVHLDDCPIENGALAVIPESHRLGKLREAQISQFGRDQFELCVARAGDVLAMKPLSIHRSSPSQSPAHRRVLHLVYASCDPSPRIRWKRG